jgi:hypothetical protein
MADDTMQKYLNSIGLVKNETWMKIGTDPKTNNMKKMWLALQILLIPDYIFVHKNLLWLSEVKGTLKLKESDYLHLQEMYERAKPYKEVRVGLTYFKHPNAKPVWFDYKTIEEIWNDESTETGYYPELDLNGNKKLYKVLTVKSP